MNQDEQPRSNARHSVAAFLMVKDCPELLHECLKRLTWVDEIVVVDASTNDRILRMLGESYPGAKHIADRTDDQRIRMNNQVHRVDSEFLLTVDADEFFTQEAALEILTALRRPCAYVAFRIPSISYLFGECLGPGATQLKLYRKDRYSWPMESVHEFPRVDGAVGTLTQPYTHHNSPRFGMLPAKIFRYEGANAALLDDAEFDKLAIDNKSAAELWRAVFVEWLRLNVRFVRTAWRSRRLGFAGAYLAYGQILQVIGRHVCRTDERRMRAGLIDRDGNGYL